MRHRFAVSANAAVNAGWTQFIYHANYKIIDPNVMDWAHLPHLPNAFSPLMSMRCRKTIALPEMARYRKLLLTSRPLLKTDAQDRCSRPLLKTAAPLLFAITKTRSSMPLGATAVVTDTLFSELYVIRVFSFYFSQLIAKVRPEEPCISAFR